jgi:hypothetical protein
VSRSQRRKTAQQPWLSAVHLRAWHAFMSVQMRMNYAMNRQLHFRQLSCGRGLSRSVTGTSSETAVYPANAGSRLRSKYSEAPATRKLLSHLRVAGQGILQRKIRFGGSAGHRNGQMMGRAYQCSMLTVLFEANHPRRLRHGSVRRVTARPLGCPLHAMGRAVGSADEDDTTVNASATRIDRIGGLVEG